MSINKLLLYIVGFSVLTFGVSATYGNNLKNGDIQIRNYHDSSGPVWFRLVTKTKVQVGNVVGPVKRGLPGFFRSHTIKKDNQNLWIETKLKNTGWQIPVGNSGSFSYTKGYGHMYTCVSTLTYSACSSG